MRFYQLVPFTQINPNRVCVPRETVFRGKIQQNIFRAALTACLLALALPLFSAIGIPQLAWAEPTNFKFSDAPAPVPTNTTSKPSAGSTKAAPSKDPDSTTKENTTDSTQTLLPGLTYRQFTQKFAQGAFNVHVLHANPKSNVLDVLPALPNTTELTGLSTTPKTIDKHHALAGVNAAFFNSGLQVPLGMVMIQGELFSGPLFERTVLGLSSNNTPMMAKLSMRAALKLPNGTVLNVDNLNQPRTNNQQTVVYSPRWGKVAPPMPGDGLQVQITQGYISALSTYQPLPIPENGYVVMGLRSNLTTIENYLQFLLYTQQGQVNTAPLELSFTTTPDWSAVKHALSGGPFLVRNGNIYIDALEQNFHPSMLRTYSARTAVGITANNHLIFVTISKSKTDGETADQKGVLLSEMAHLMKNLGAQHAMNLDGGGSTQMIVNGALVTQNSWTRPVSACWIMRPKDLISTTSQTQPYK